MLALSGLTKHGIGLFQIGLFQVVNARCWFLFVEFRPRDAFMGVAAVRAMVAHMVPLRSMWATCMAAR